MGLRQIIWNNEAQVFWRIHVAHGLDDFIAICRNQCEINPTSPTAQPITKYQNDYNKYNM